MKQKVIQKILGILLFGFGLILLTPVVVSIIYDDQTYYSFVIAAFINLLIGFALWAPNRNSNDELKIRDGFIVVVLFWVVLSIGGSVPFLITDSIGLTFFEAIFESFSALTTTGATVIANLEVLPKSILFYRQLLQWLGGMGIIVLAVAILPILGVGGMQLYKAETPGPNKDSKLTPRIKETAKALWVIYLALTCFCAVSYFFAGMPLFDAISHSFSTIAIGGFSIHNASIGHYDSIAIDFTVSIFMLLAAINFSLHFLAWKNKNLSSYVKDSEFKGYLLILLAVTAIITINLYTRTYQGDFLLTLRYSIFQAISFCTTTGFTNTQFQIWPPFVIFILLIAACVGGCAGSTAGGIKVVRFIFMIKKSTHEIKQLIHPNALIPMRLGQRPINSRIIEGVWGFLGAYVVIFILTFLALNLQGLDTKTAFSAVVACINNLGPGLGAVSNDYSMLNDVSKMILCLAMLLGRLEIFTLLVVLSPAFWRT